MVLIAYGVGVRCRLLCSACCVWKGKSMYIDRRNFIAMAGSAALGGCREIGPCAPCTAPLAYDDTLRDHCWMWGHDSGHYDGTGKSSVYNIPLSDPITMPDACAYMGIPNVCSVTWNPPESDDYLAPFSKMKRVSWVVCGGETSYDRLQANCFRLLEKMPNLVGLDLDDYFTYKPEPEMFDTGSGVIKVAPSKIGHAELLKLRRRIDAYSRKVDLRMVVYADYLEDAYAPALAVPDTILFWTWTGKNLAKLRENFARYRRLAPGKNTLLGIYMWDFGGKKPLDIDFMRSQLDIAHELYMKHEIDGFIFHCTPLVNKKPAIEAVECAREWIARHGDEARG